MKNIIAIFLISIVSISSKVNADPMTMIDLLNVSSVSEPRLSPDGKSFLYVKSDADWVKNINVKHIWRTNISKNNETQNPQQITSNIAEATDPRWSNDGRFILFLSKRGDDKYKQIYILPQGGGEAVRLSNHATPVSSAQWSKDSREIYFLAKDKKSDQQINRELEKNDTFKFEQNYQQKHLWKISTLNGQETRISSGDYTVTSFELSQNGEKIIYKRAPDPLLDSASKSEVWIMDRANLKTTQITFNDNYEINAELSPDQKSLLYIAWTDENDQPYFENNLFIISAQGGKAQKMLGNFDHDIQQAHWSKDANSIYFKANLGVHNELFKLNVKSGQISQLTDAKHTVNSWHYLPEINSHIMSIKTAHNNGDFWILNNKSKSKPVKITRIFDHLENDFDLPQQDIIRWKGQDGVTIEGTIIYPNNYQKGNRYPLVVQTHGGPRASDQWGIYSNTSYGPVLAAAGYVILRPNYRGSVGYGDEFVRDMVGSYFNQAHLDVMAGVDYLIDQGIADGDKMVKMGYSAGGHLTNKIITFTDRFKAASSAAGAVDWISMYSQSDTRTYRTPWFGGTPWQKDAPIETYWDQSPLKDIANVSTPTLIIVGGADVRVPKQQSIELYRALKSNGVKTVLYIVPRENHIWKELRHKLSKMNVEMSWFEKYVNDRVFKKQEIYKNENDLTKAIVVD